MASDQEKILFLFERVSEPLYNSPRGSKNTFFNVPTDNMCESQKHAMQTKWKDMEAGNNVITVKKPHNMPDLSRFGAICPRKGLFSYFLPSHRQLCGELRDILMNQNSSDDVFTMACACRDNAMINPQLFVTALSSCILSRKDMKKIRLPPFYQIMPDHFLDASSTQKAQEIGRMPMEDRMIVPINQGKGTTGRDTNPENRLWYFREDIGTNSHHFHWHVVFHGGTPKFPNPNSRNRRGELFYYMHHSMIARYEAERLCNGLSLTKPINLEDPLVTEGYFGKLYSTNSGINWGTRQENTVLKDIDRTVNKERTVVKLEELKRWRDRILEAIDSGYVLAKGPNGEDARIKLTDFEGIDILGDIIENSQSLSVNSRFYGPFGFHNMGHVMICFAQDPRYKYSEHMGPMGDTSTALRDPAFYRWHKYIDIMLDQWKQGLNPYTDVGNEYSLKWNNIKVVKANALSLRDEARPNILSTFWMQSDIDLARGIDFGRTDKKMLGSVWGRFTHLQYDEFNYNVSIENNNAQPKLATVRIFMAPVYDEHGDRFSLTEQRPLYFELDKFSITLKQGVNNIQRSSKDSSVTIPWESSFNQLENLSKQEMADISASEGVCGCGWPQHMLLPRGTPEGSEFDIVVFLTDGQMDKPKGGKGMEDTKMNGKCRQAMSFCGVLDEMYPDSKPMGYPFDRNPMLIPNPDNPKGDQVPVDFIENLTSRIDNMSVFRVKIVHEPTRSEIRITGDTAPVDMEMMPDLGCNSTNFVSKGPIIPKRNNPRGPGRGIPQTGSPMGWNGQSSSPASRVHFPNNPPTKGRYGRRDSRDEDEDWEDLANRDYDGYYHH